MDIDAFWVCLSNASEDNFIVTEHFLKRLESRKSKDFPDLNGILDIAMNKKPVGILIQSEEKFKVYYSTNNVYDLVVVFAIKNTNPVRIALVTCYKQDTKRIVR